MFEIIIMTFKGLGIIREGVIMDGLREEPHFESMIFSDVGQRLNMRRMSSLVDPEVAVDNNDAQTSTNTEDIDLKNLYENLDPVYFTGSDPDKRDQI